MIAGLLPIPYFWFTSGNVIWIYVDDEDESIKCEYVRVLQCIVVPHPRKTNETKTGYMKHKIREPHPPARPRAICRGPARSAAGAGWPWPVGPTGHRPPRGHRPAKGREHSHDTTHILHYNDTSALDGFREIPTDRMCPVTECAPLSPYSNSLSDTLIQASIRPKKSPSV